MLSFSLQEYQYRLEQTKQKMLHLGIEVLLITNPANMNYLSGYNGWSFYVDQMLVVIVDKDQPIWIGRKMDANGARATTWLLDDHIIPYPERYIHSEEKHPMEFIAHILEKMGQANRVIGLEMGSYYFSALAYEKLKASLPNATFKDASLLVNNVRLIKSNQEIQYMKRAAKLVEKGMDAAISHIEVGARECDVVGQIYKQLISGTKEFGGDYPAIVPLLPSGENTSTPHLTWSDREYEYGDMVIIELAGCYQRYHSPLARTVSLGEPSEEAYEVSKIVVEGLNAALDIVKPGITCEEIEHAWNREIKKYGIVKESRLGYSMGLSYPPDWGEHTVSIRRGDKTVLQPNMTFHLIPGLWFDDYGIEISESFRVTADGCEVFANYQRELIIKENLDLTSIS